MKTTLIVNPKADKGRSAKLLPQITRTLKQLGIVFEARQTEAPRQAIEMARQAAASGSQRVVAVGGDGTCNEVVNGLLLAAGAGQNAIFGVIPTGSAQVFAALDIYYDFPVKS